MTAVVPPIFTPIYDEEVAIEIPTNEELLRKFIRNYNFLGNLIAVGTIVFIDFSLNNVTTPDVDYWQICDGSEITNPNSPIRTVGAVHKFTPDLREKFIVAANSTAANNSANSPVYNLAHDHGGETTTQIPSPPLIYESSGSSSAPFRADPTHKHTINSWGGTITHGTTGIDCPSYYKVAAYIKIQ